MSRLGVSASFVRGYWFPKHMWTPSRRWFSTSLMQSFLHGSSRAWYTDARTPSCDLRRRFISSTLHLNRNDVRSQGQPSPVSSSSTIHVSYIFCASIFLYQDVKFFFKNKNFNFFLSWCYVTDFIEGLIRTICFIIECIKSSLLERLERHCRSYII